MQLCVRRRIEEHRRHVHRSEALSNLVYTSFFSVQFTHRFVRFLAAIKLQASRIEIMILFELGRLCVYLLFIFYIYIFISYNDQHNRNNRRSH